MNIQLAKLKRIAIFLAGISTASIPTLAHADWSIMGLGTLGGTYSWVSGINDSGQVVGTISTVDGLHQNAFITGPNGVGLTKLGTLGGTSSGAIGINNSGDVLGYAETVNGDQHSFIFSHGEMTDLSVLASVLAAGWSNLGFIDINNNKQILGVGLHDGNQEAFILSYISAVPEPETYAMLLAGLGLLGFMARRRKVSAV